MVLSSCEHISYILNDEAYSLEGFDFSGLPDAGLSMLLYGTKFTAGIVDFTDPVTISIGSKVTRRKALMLYIAVLGGKIEYSGKRINMRRSRGSVQVKKFMGWKNTKDISVTYDSRAMVASFELMFPPHIQSFSWR